MIALVFPTSNNVMINGWRSWRVSGVCLEAFFLSFFFASSAYHFIMGGALDATRLRRAIRYLPQHIWDSEEGRVRVAEASILSFDFSSC